MVCVFGFMISNITEFALEWGEKVSIGKGFLSKVSSQIIRPKTDVLRPGTRRITPGIFLFD